MAFKKMKLMDSLDAETAKSKHAAVAENLGREIRVFKNSTASLSTDASSSSNEEPDDIYDLTPEDYYHIMSDKIGVQCQVLKTRTIREAEAKARRERFTKAVIRVRFPDDYILEATFHPSEKIQSLVDLLLKAVARPDLPFYLYTTPQKEKINDMSKDFYLAGFVPGAIVYFSYDLPKDFSNSDASTGSYLCKEIILLSNMPVTPKQADPVKFDLVPAFVESISYVPKANPGIKKSIKPKWFR